MGNLRGCLLSVRGGRGTSITLSFGIKTFDGVVKSPPSTDALCTLCISNHAVEVSSKACTPRRVCKDFGVRKWYPVLLLPQELKNLIP